MGKHLRNGLIFLSIFLFITSLFQPAFFIDREDSDAYSNSLILFALGWISFLGGGIVPFIIWLANPFYLLTLYLLISKKSKFAIITIAISLSLSLIFVKLDSILTSESGATSKITELGTGYYLWVLSFIILALSSIYNFIKYVIKL